MRRFISFLFLFFHTLITAAVANPLNNMVSNFDLKTANQQFDHINLQLSVQNLNLNNLESAVTTLTTLTTQSDHCVEEVQKKLANINSLMPQGNSPINATDQGVDLVYLKSQQKDLGDEEAQCRLFSIRAKEAIDAYKTAIAQLKQEEALTRGLPLWKIAEELYAKPFHFNLEEYYKKNCPGSQAILYFFLLVAATLLMSFGLLKKFSKSHLALHYLRLKAISMHSIFFLGAVLFTGGTVIYLSTNFAPYEPINLALNLSEILCAYFITLLFTLFAFKIKKIRAIFYWYRLDIRFFQSVSIASLSFYTAALITRLIIHIVNTNLIFSQLCQSLFILSIIFYSWRFIYKFCHLHQHFQFIKNHQLFIWRFSTLLHLSCVILCIRGYYTLTEHLIFSGFLTITILSLVLLITHSIRRLYFALTQQPAIKSKIIKYFGYKQDQMFIEFHILRLVGQAIIVATGIYFIGQSWGFATDLIETLYDHLVNGVHLANTTIYPTRILLGITIFCLLYLVCRAISTAISRHQQFENEEETQVAVASILTYIGFSLALISGLLVAGFDFTGLAIIAGALSVGIGLGLQSIVNNFVSGVILLIEKPIRPGDRINVVGVEGFVKKVRVRSTHIITPSREDIIIPNSDLITRPVTNYMFSDMYCRICCDIGVSYGSDTYLVRDVLLSIANHHEEVIKTGRNKPVVLFRSFADNALDFQLVCLIRDVNLKAQVQSELNFAINQAFQEHHIDMPFPQREVHIKMNELEPVAKKISEPTTTVPA